MIFSNSYIQSFAFWQSCVSRRDLYVHRSMTSPRHRRSSILLNTTQFSLFGIDWLVFLNIIGRRIVAVSILKSKAFALIFKNDSCSMSETIEDFPYPAHPLPLPSDLLIRFAFYHIHLAYDDCLAFNFHKSPAVVNSLSISFFFFVHLATRPLSCVVVSANWSVNSWTSLPLK